MSVPVEILQALNPISLEEMNNVKLMNRTDSKFVTTLPTIVELLLSAGNDYLIQNIDGKTNMPYFTCYFDTPEVDMFYQHQRGKKNRQKIRTRIYEGTSDIPYLEIKSKNNKGRTRKKRVLMEENSDIIFYSDFIEKNSIYSPRDLQPVISNHFYRITLVNKNMTERITIDTTLEFHNLSNHKHISLDNIGIIEWKRDGISGKSNLERILRDLRIKSTGFSKYCMGMAMTQPSLRHNRLKAKISHIERLNAKF